MAHRITTRVPSHDIENANVTIEIRTDEGALFGELRIGQGTIGWRAGHHQYVYRMGWKRFDAFMQERGRPRKKKR